MDARVIRQRLTLLAAVLLSLATVTTAGCTCAPSATPTSTPTSVPQASPIRTPWPKPTPMPTPGPSPTPTATPLPPTPTFSPVFGPPLKMRVTNISSSAFTVAWVTDIPCDGYVEYGPSPALGGRAYDDRGQGMVDDTHHVSIGGLMPETVYYYDIISGGMRYNNSGAHYQVTTGPTHTPPTSNLIFGRVLKRDGSTIAEGTIVYIKVVDGDGQGSPGSSQEWSRLVEEHGFWNANLGTVRTANLKEWFIYDPEGGDEVWLEAEGAGEGRASLVVAVGVTRRDPPLAPDMVLW